MSGQGPRQSQKRNEWKEQWGRTYANANEN